MAGGKTASSTVWYRQLWVQVLVAMALGIGLGIFRPDTGARMQPLGDAFIKAIRMLIAPIIFCTVVHGIARMSDLARVGRVAVKAIVYFEVLTTIALVIGLAAVNILQPGKGMNVDLSHVDASAVKQYATQKSDAHAIPDEHHSANPGGRIRRGQRAAGPVHFGAVWIRSCEAGGTREIDYRADRRSFPGAVRGGGNGDVGGAARGFRGHRFHGGQVWGGIKPLSLGKLLLGGFYLTCLIFVFWGRWGPCARGRDSACLKLIPLHSRRTADCFCHNVVGMQRCCRASSARLEDLGCEESVVRLEIPTA